MCFIFMNNVFAADLEFSVNAVANKTEVVSGNEVNIRVSLKSVSSITSCLFKIEEDSSIEAVSKTSMNNWTIPEGGEDQSGIIVESSSLSSDLSNGVNILELKYKVNGDGKVTIKTIECASSDELSGTYQDVVVNLKVQDLSDITTLSSITVGGGTVTNFSSDNLKPLIILDSPNFGLTFTATNPDYQDDIVVTDVSGNVIRDLANLVYDDPSGQGMMTLYATVNNVTKYELGIMYENKELDNSLSSLTVAGQKVNLIADKLEYNVKINNDVNVVEVLAELADSKNFQFAGGNGPGTFSTTGSTTTIALIVEPKDSSSGATSVTYLIELVKEGTTGGDVAQSSSSSNLNNATSNPQTGNISMFIMAIILVASLVGSMFLYQRNLEGYK